MEVQRVMLLRLCFLEETKQNPQTTKTAFTTNLPTKKRVAAKVAQFY